jgi:stringent starvation protein B
MAADKDNTNRQKRETLERLLNEEHVLVHIVPSAEGVSVPANLVATSTLTLKLSRHFRGRMQLKPEEVVAELLFGENYFTCKVPYPAIWGVTSFKGQFLMWPESAPDEVLESMAKIEEKRRADQKQGLEVSSENSEAVPDDNSPPKKNGPPKLRRVK